MKRYRVRTTNNQIVDVLAESFEFGNDGLLCFTIKDGEIVGVFHTTQLVGFVNIENIAPNES